MMLDCHLAKSIAEKEMVIEMGKVYKNDRYIKKLVSHVVGIFNITALF